MYRLSVSLGKIIWNKSMVSSNETQKTEKQTNQNKNNTYRDKKQL
jgi:hypothetical protein